MTNPDNATLLAQIEALRAENERLKLAKATATRITLKVSEKGGFSAYGLGRFPVTLYAAQWEKLLAHSDDVLEFVKAHANDPRVVRAAEEHAKPKPTA